MKLVSLLFITLLLASCGQDSGSGSGAGKKQAQEEGCSLNGNLVACESIRGADGLGIDLLETMIDVPVKIEGTDMTFLSDKSAMMNGRRIDCKVAVKEGEKYRLALRGDKLQVMTGEGSYEMERISEGTGVNGTWTWTGYVDQGTHQLRTMTIISSNRAILQTNCEL